MAYQISKCTSNTIYNFKLQNLKIKLKLKKTVIFFNGVHNPPNLLWIWHHYAIHRNEKYPKNGTDYFFLKYFTNNNKFKQRNIDNEQ